MRKLSCKYNNQTRSKRADLFNGGTNGRSGYFLLENGDFQNGSRKIFQGAVKLIEETDKILRLRSARHRG